jgi:glycosyltransferase involved in cell wall biosynthesis
MKILFIAPINSIHTIRWVNYFAKCNNEIILLDFLNNSSKSQELPYNKNVILIKHKSNTNLLLDILLRYILIRKTILKYKPLIVHVHFIHINAFITSLISKKNLILTAWGSDIHTSPRKSLLNKYIVKFALKRATLITTQTRYLEKLMLDYEKKSKIKLIHHGINLENIKKRTLNEIVEKSIFIDGFPIVFSPRIMKKFYNIDVILEAMILLKNEFPNIKLILSKFGVDSNYYNQILKIVKNNNFENNVIFLDEIRYEEMSYYYSLSDFTISMANDDCGGLSIIESMLCESIPIVNNLETYKDFFIDKINGFIVGKIDKQQIFETIKFALNGQQDLNILRHNNIIFYKTFDVNQKMNEMNSLYLTLEKNEL